MCDFCDKIFTEEEIKKLYTWERCEHVIYDPENNVYGIWMDCDDEYYSGWALDINYCPKCGRKLNV